MRFVKLTDEPKCPNCGGEDEDLITGKGHICWNYMYEPRATLEISCKACGQDFVLHFNMHSISWRIP